MTNIGTKFLLAQRFVFDPNSNSLTDQQSNNELIRLGSNESRILLMLTERPNQILTRGELHEFVWREQGFEVDDSSLTQAISTLRKLLKDSTKSPQFVKTVPKRGYQLICSVERLNPLMTDTVNDSEVIQEEEALVGEDSPNSGIGDTAIDANLESVPAVPQSKPKAIQKKANWTSRSLVIAAILLPIFVFLFTNPAESKFREVARFNDVPVLTPVNHPQLSQWLPSVEQCIQRYVEHHVEESLPIKVIATGGQNNQLILNYIHAVDYSFENVTLRIFANRNDPTDICKKGS